MAPQPERRRILVTGVADPAVGELVRRLEDDSRVEHIAALDFREPRRAFRRTDFIRADLSSAALKHLLESIRPDTILHLQRMRTDLDGSTPAHQLRKVDVLGTINLVATVKSVPFVRKLVMAGAVHLYDADGADIEATINELTRSGRRMVLTCLRFADIIGPRINNPISRYLRMPVVPTVFGIDPLLQFCDEEDAIAVLKRAATLDLPGVFNVAGDGAIFLSRAIRLGGGRQIPVAPPIAPAIFSALRTLGVADIQQYYALLPRYSGAMDNETLKTRFGYQPRYSTIDAVLHLRNGVAFERPAKPQTTELHREGRSAA